MIAPAQKEPDLALAGLALIVIFGLLIWHDHPMRSDRPFDSSVMQPQYPHTTGYTYESWLWQDPFSFDSSEYVQKDQYYIEFDNYEEKPPWPKSLRLRKKLDLEGDNKSKDAAKSYLCTIQFAEYAKKNLASKILLSLVNVRPNTVENKETRIRHRYAVIAGLIESGYYPSRPDRLNFCASSNNNRQFDVRWEHFSHESNEKNIIVAWVDSNTFFEINSKEENSKFISFVPDIYQNVDVHIFGWIGAIDAQTNGALPQHKNIKVIKPHAQINQELSKKLVEELKNRRITKPSEIAIITEQDSKAVRSLVQAFKKSFNNEGNKITTFSYFKGLDAYQQIIDKPGQNEDYQASRQWDIRLSATDLRNPPVGPAQYDYLHRIAREIRQTHDVIDLEKRVTGIKAVGIFGSDFYDKLLVLKALRAEMPSLLVFTTDLDAQMFHPQHWRWTRNLVVASPFDLRLNEQHQKLFPAFRDNQQTEIFYRTLCILEPGKCSPGNGQASEKLPNIEDVPSLIFEIGRDGPVRLTLPEEGTIETTIHPTNNSLEQSHFQIKLLFGITLTLILIVAAFRPHSGALVGWLLLSSAAIFALALLVALADVASEPFSFTNGISLWPTIFIQTIVILLAIAFSVKGLFNLESNFSRLNKQYFKNRSDLEMRWPDREPKSIRSILKVNQSGKSKPEQQETPQDNANNTTKTRLFCDLEHFRIKYLQPTCSLVQEGFVYIFRKKIKLTGFFIVFLIGTSFFVYYVFNDADPKRVIFFIVCFVVLTVLVVLCFWIEYKYKTKYSLAIFLIVASGFVYIFNDVDPEGVISFIVCLALLTILVIICFWIEYARPQAIKSIIFWAETDNYYQDQQANLKFSPQKIIAVGLLILLVPIGIILYVLLNHFLSEQIDPENVIFWLLLIYAAWYITRLLIKFIDCCHSDKTDQPKDKDAQRFILLQEDDGKSGLWQEYHQYSRLDQILFRIAVMWLFFAIIETILFYLLPPWPSPYRGTSLDWNQWTGIFGFFFTMLLTFFVLDAVRLNYYFIRKLRTKHPLLLDDTTVLNTDGLTSDDMKKFYHERKDNPLETLEKIVTLVAERTLVADKLIYYPLLCIMLMLFARITYFDNQDFPLSKAITFGTAISLLIFSGFMIRYEAQKLKQAAVMSAENLVGNIDPDGHRCVRKLKEINGGIFQPMLEQPVMRALLLILASIGLFAGEYLMLANF
ncbi:MAG: hypothetical protein KF888_04115 [Nitrosomonas sp.]|nr:hypothetical protein [Nitrosomonas sp.]